MTRDPRLNPLPGDMVTVGDAIRHVRFVRTAIGGGGLTIVYRSPAGDASRRTGIDCWRYWAKPSTEFTTRKEQTT